MTPFNSDEFWTIAGQAGEGMIFTFAPEPRNFPTAKAVVEKFKDIRLRSGRLHALHLCRDAGWAQAAAATGGTDSKKIAEWLRAGNTLNTVLGDIALNEKGDLKDAELRLVQVLERQVLRKTRR